MVTRAEVRRDGAQRVSARGVVRTGSSLHPAAWLVWLLGGSVAVFLTSNPLYLALALLSAFGVYLSLGDSVKGRALWPFVKIGLALAALSIPFNVLTGSSGPTVLATLPELSFPGWFGGVTLGGPVTGEALISATSRALGIATLVALAAAFNSAVDHFRLVRLAPRGLSQVMHTLTIALVLVPQALAQARAVAEAQRLRGRRARGLRALPGLLLPTLRGALERSVQRAESLDARGFGAGVRARGWLPTIAGVAGLGVSAWGAFAYYYYGVSPRTAGVLVAGVALVAVAVLRSGGVPRHRLRAEHWEWRDAVVVGTALLAVALVLGLRVTGVGDASYLSYPELSAPAFHPAGAAAFLLLLVPAVPALLAQAPSEGDP